VLVILANCGILVPNTNKESIMDYNSLLDLAADLGYRLAMSGAETYRIEESIDRIMDAYGIVSESFAIPNCLTVSIETAEGKPMTRMRRIGYHGNDLDSVERYSNLGRKICTQKPEPAVARQWLKQADADKRKYPTLIFLLGNYLGACGFAVFFGASVPDSLLAGIAGIIIGLVNMAMDNLKANLFFRTILASFLMAFFSYTLGAFHIAENPDTVIIGALMILVPGLLFTNAMRDIIYGDTNSGINRIVQVFLIAAAIALGTAAAWSIVSSLWRTPEVIAVRNYNLIIQLLACGIGCFGFTVLFNIHGPGGLLCVLGGCIGWACYSITLHLTGSDLAAYFWAAVAASIYSEAMARIRKYPAISYLVVSIFPLIPGASIYYTMSHALRSDMASFVSRGTHTIAIAGSIAVGLLLVSTCFRMWATWKWRKNM